MTLYSLLVIEGEVEMLKEVELGLSLYLYSVYLKPLAVAILSSMTFYPWRLFCHQTFVIGQF